ncbi:Cobalt/magnesium transport protein CorA [Streptomyces xanthophaeus]|nr:Cobalt/magnesium transport protein CorA [Streptomyces xanthophaeus]
MHAHQRPKLERYDDMLFLVLKTIVYVDHEKVTETSEIVDTGEIMVFAGPGYAITVRHGSAPPLDDVRRKLQDDPQQLGCGPAAVLHAVADMVVDRYMDVADAFAGDVDSLEAEVFSPDRPVDAGRIYQLKRELLEFKRAVMPLAGALQRLSEGAFPGIPAKVATYFRDVATTTSGSANRSCPSTNSSPACSVPASPSSASSRTPTCAASAPGPPSSPSPP